MWCAPFTVDGGIGGPCGNGRRAGVKLAKGTDKKRSQELGETPGGMIQDRMIVCT